MIARLTGRCVHVDEDSLIIDCGGVGYLVRATVGVISAAAAAGQQPVTVDIHTQVKEDAIQLFGFASRAEQSLFELLLTLQGVGPKAAMAIVSAYPVADIRRAAEHEDVALFQSIHGIGPKVARRIVTELRDRMASLPAQGTTTFGATVQDVTFYDARAALVELGLSLPVAEQALRDTSSEATVDERVKQALQAVRS